MNMKQFAVAGLALLACAHGAQAALQGRDADGNASNGFEAYYDTVLDVTWWGDAGLGGYTNAAAADAFASAQSLGNQTGWRLPTTAPLNGSAFNYAAVKLDGTGDVGFNITSPKSELSYMYYVNLGLPAMTSGFAWTGGDITVGAVTFKNLAGDTYWTGTVANDGFNSCNPSSAYQGCRWVFEMGFGLQEYYSLNQPSASQLTRGNVWLVHDGDVFATAVPEPDAYALMFVGLGLLGVQARRARRSGMH